jgi:hypothetical protein
MGTDARFTLALVLCDREGSGPPISMAIPCDAALRIGWRAVDELKTGLTTIPFDEAVTMMRVKEMRRKIFRQIAERLAMQLADRMEDAEGWHDPDRIGPAREQLGGDWSR